MAKAFAIGGFLVLLAVVLNGCGGCSSDDANTCAQTFASAVQAAGTDMKILCSGLTAYTGCIKDAGCCDADGMKATLDGAVAQYNAVCTGTMATTNKCT
jgi:hypothetical protein